MRGECLVQGKKCLFDLRFTPTCVGNTGKAISFYSNYEDHPHVRGEYLKKSSSARTA